MSLPPLPHRGRHGQAGGDALDRKMGGRAHRGDPVDRDRRGRAIGDPIRPLLGERRVPRAEHADRHLRRGRRDARGSARLRVVSGREPGLDQDGALRSRCIGRDARGKGRRGRELGREVGRADACAPIGMKPPRGERGDGDGDGAHRARESAANVGGRHAMRSLADELARRDPTARRRREGACSRRDGTRYLRRLYLRRPPRMLARMGADVARRVRRRSLRLTVDPAR